MKPIFITILLTIVCFASGHAQDIILHTVTDALEYAMTYNPDLQLYKQNQNKAKKDYEAARYHWLPSVSASFTSENNIDIPVTTLPGEIFGQPGQIIETELGQQYNYNTGIAISKNILDLQFRISANIAELNTQLSGANHQAFKQLLAEQVSLYYYTAIITSQAIRVQQDNIRSATDVLDLVNQKFEEGLVDRHTVNLAKINKHTITQNLNTYQIIFEQSDYNLKILFGMEMDANLEFSEIIDPAAHQVPSVEAMGPDKNLEVFALKLKQSGEIVNQQRANWVPKLTLNYYQGAQQYRNESGISFDNGDWSKVSFLSFNISIPIFNRLSTKNKVDAALIDYDMSKLTYNYEKLKSQKEDDFTIREYNHNSRSVESAQEIYVLSKDNMTIQYQKFEEGLVGLETYLDSFDDFLKSETSYLSLLTDLYSNYAKILSRSF